MLIDACIVLLVIGTVYRSWGSGFVRQFCGSLGFFGGLLLGRLLESHTVHFNNGSDGQAVLAVLTILAVALVGLTAGEYLGLSLKRRLLKFRANRADNVFGSLLTAVSVLLSVWLLAAVISSLPPNGLQAAGEKSRIVSGLNRLLPPAPRVLAGIGKLVDPNGFPDVFIGNEPIPRGNIDLPALGDLATAVNATKDSVVRLEGQGCGGIVSGSGFVVRDGLIATNAHVVAGIRQTYVQDVNGTHKGQVVWFDPDLDLAVMRVPDLGGKPLKFDTATAPPGTPAAIVGYPSGGAFKAGPAAILSKIKASGHDIYGRGLTIRDIYEVKGTVIPGNSGGPLVGKDGRVLGVIFAESTSYEHVGYVLTATKVAAEVQQAASRQQPVSTGSCAE